jgi:general secretion pathway protein J
MSRERGFTLVEMLIALAIFGMLSAAGVALLSVSVKAQETASAHLDRLAELRKAGALLASDLGQAAGRVSRDEEGRPHPAFYGGSGAEEGVLLGLVRRGWDNEAGAPRASLQKVEYRLTGGRLERLAYPHVDGSGPMAPSVLAEGLSAIRLRYRDKNGEWRDRWDPTQATDMPRAVEIVVETERAGSVRQLFLSGTGA